MREVGVVHLVRRGNDPAAFERFLSSYRKHPAGEAHELIVVFKGFPLRGGTRDYDGLLALQPHQRVYVADIGFDLRPYFVAAQKFDFRYFLFLNSFSRILDDDWLAKFCRWIRIDGVGLVGATGSYESLSDRCRERARMLAALGRGDRFRWRVSHLIADRRAPVVLRRAAGWLADALGVEDPRSRFPAFPNFHVRTNAFMVARDTLLRVRRGPLLLKFSAYALESGPDSITRQVMGLGLAPLVISRNGEAFEKERWHLTNIFRQSRQQDLLVADNQTCAYEAADAQSRAELSRMTWGQFARPG